MKKFITILTAVSSVMFALSVVDRNLSSVRGEWIYTFMIILALICAIDFTMAVVDVYEEKRQGRAVRGRTKGEWDSSEFSDPEIEAMWNRSYYFVSRGMESPKGLISGKEEF